MHSTTIFMYFAWPFFKSCIIIIYNFSVPVFFWIWYSTYFKFNKSFVFISVFVIFFQKQVKESDYGTDIQSIKAEYERHQKEHKVIDQFQGNVEKCREAEVRFHGEELKIYGERMTILQKAYNELLVLSNKRVSDLHTLHDFITAAHSGINVDWVRAEL